VIIGNPGSGKTYFCSALADLAFRKYSTVRYWNEKKLMSRLRQAIDEDQDYGEVLKYCLDDEFVFLDDIGSMPANDWRKEVIFSAIDNRYSSALPTVITSNLTKKEFTDRYEQRTHSRIFAKENTIIELWGFEDLRTTGL
jgi:DNA replication protein DnaC